MSNRWRELPDVLAWSGGNENLDEHHYVISKVSLADVSAIIGVHSPLFTEVHGCVVRAGSYVDETGILDYLETVKGDRSVTERVVNRLCVWDYFSEESESEIAEEWRVAQWFATGWLGSAQAQFPDRNFATEVSDASNYGPEVTIWCRR